MTAERKAELKELQGFVNTAYTAVGKVIEVIHEKVMQDDLDDNW